MKLTYLTVSSLARAPDISDATRYLERGIAIYSASVQVCKVSTYLPGIPMRHSKLISSRMNDTLARRAGDGRNIFSPRPAISTQEVGKNRNQVLSYLNLSLNQAFCSSHLEPLPPPACPGGLFSIPVACVTCHAHKSIIKNFISPHPKVRSTPYWSSNKWRTWTLN